ncbi:putative transcriptional regulator, Crp/Fnr family [Bradyrhizobium oligotrophicum S58]|uniref:Putative transcriptional regulator, Crp/Fnr family n=1 Tax=Bradyrhizobium oligotrophicum S58 TaxID=1245469 RepID=M4Z754_9BRAD|nr:putative transcriptional regulator, Crp/Fnr family [Bradyrhizobium oligotrophicum S58]
MTGGRINEHTADVVVRRLRAFRAVSNEAAAKLEDVVRGRIVVAQRGRTWPARAMPPAAYA